MMVRKHHDDPLHGAAVHVPRTRGATSGILLLALGAWGALIPFIGPLFNFAYSPDTSWHWTKGRGWLEVLPGVVVLVGGLFLLLSANRITTSTGAWLAVAGGAWFVIGADFASLLHLGSAGVATGKSKGVRLLEELAYFDGLGVLIVLIAATALGRLSVRSVRDVRAAQRREAAQEKEAEQHRRDAQAEARNRHSDQEPMVQDGRPAPVADQGSEQPPLEEARSGQSVNGLNTTSPHDVADNTGHSRAAGATAANEPRNS